MSLRWRNGALLCGAKTIEKSDDIYIDDGLHYQLSLIGAIVPDKEEHTNGVWHWVQHTPYWDWI